MSMEDCEVEVVRANRMHELFQPHAQIGKERDRAENVILYTVPSLYAVFATNASHGSSMWSIGYQIFVV